MGFFVQIDQLQERFQPAQNAYWRWRFEKSVLIRYLK